MSSDQLTEAEAAQYDRQIRLWGLDAQQRIRQARVLLIGIRGVNTEICKNLVLSGVGNVVIQDSLAVTMSDLSAQFFLTEADVGKNAAEASRERANELNPLVTVTADAVNIATRDEAYFKQFSLVCASCLPVQELVRINEICRANKVSFYATDAFGFHAYFFADSGVHTFKVKDQQDQQTYVSLQTSLSSSWKPLGRRCPKLLLALIVLFSFQQAHGRLPAPDGSDGAALEQTRTAACAAQEVSADFVPAELVAYVSH
eukprot:TRINITY_DN4160_c0_g1_i2.p1 TRINITY_DN4160_c0_g1~~TRINITY_DN4160_c0_g1_i2.p1  ORF type:complete len:258 (+),score=67.23 TRINITY_DN4160_c0_g1_i2:28-801(+)